MVSLGFSGQWSLCSWHLPTAARQAQMPRLSTQRVPGEIIGSGAFGIYHDWWVPGISPTKAQADQGCSGPIAPSVGVPAWSGLWVVSTLSFSRAPPGQGHVCHLPRCQQGKGW